MRYPHDITQVVSRTYYQSNHQPQLIIPYYAKQTSLRSVTAPDAVSETDFSVGETDTSIWQDWRR
jgi:hypothetical protein